MTRAASPLLVAALAACWSARRAAGGGAAAVARRGRRARRAVRRPDGADRRHARRPPGVRSRARGRRTPAGCGPASAPPTAAADAAVRRALARRRAGGARAATRSALAARPRRRPRGDLPRLVRGHARRRRARRRRTRRAAGCCCASSAPRPASRARAPNATIARRAPRERAGSTPAARATAVAKDLLDAYQARLRELLDDAGRGAERELPERRAEAAAQADGLLRDPRRPLRRGPRGRRRRAGARRRYAALRRAALGDGPGRVRRRPRPRRGALEGFTAAPFTAEEAARRAQQLLRFLALVPVEYGRGVEGHDRAPGLRDPGGGRVPHRRRRPRSPTCATSSPSATRRATDAAAAGIDRLGRLVAVATRAAARACRTTDEVEAQTKSVEDALDAAMPEAWQESTDESDYDLIALTLDRMQAAAGAGQFRQAEQARLEAYSFFEFGPERRLKAFDPGPGAHDRGPDLVRRRRPAGPGEADRRPRPAARAARDAARARRRSSPTPPPRSATARAAPPWSPTRRSSCSARASRRC